MSTTAPAALVIGTHTWSPDNYDKAKSIVEAARQHGISVLDTARSYGRGGSETVLGSLGLYSDFSIDTKIPTGFMPGAAGNIENLAKESFAALKSNRVRTLFLHGADETVPFSDQMAEIQKLYSEGHFERFGLSNFTLSQLLDLVNVAKSKGYILPTVYQSSYSVVARQNEVLLFPTLRALGICIEAFSPLAAGFLAKTPNDIEKGHGSWDASTPMGRFNRDLFYKPTYMQLLHQFSRIAQECQESQSGLAYRWVRYHSVLDGNLGDSMILGAATCEQLNETLAELDKGPLEPYLVQRISDLWEIVKHEEPVDNLKSAQRVFQA
ncbi:hypothetical protein MRS44_017019 [Fusarium solani]|uniref:NADP-dependent oxidoreductase domain-containing protein n=1 Tax=Fusarium solani TaxID=169388 RepID=A0A9P9JZV8_FUSSL|nr:NADP-dependent oxidoreductase domain-containing protein [Fusarium solani]KAH7243927.1 NADP-dependent oxidoreductase domain-containing protein [Fusarium solani]KAJ3455537.1 hypothetical protein MRS44_017019 [Fusarium solani]KAJ4191811.1 hypothetical protein NW759_016668 [Fusarium solani]